jgi:DNA-binding HxlR family transcriptional regulator
MNKLNFETKTCIPSLKLLGDFWTLRIVDALSDGPLRYCELQRAAGDVNPVTLTTKLKKLEQAQLVSRNKKSSTGVSYRLTELGKQMLPVLDAVNKFSEAAKVQSI